MPGRRDVMARLATLAAAVALAWAGMALAQPASSAPTAVRGARPPAGLLDASGHESSEGLMLIGATGETYPPLAGGPTRCAPGVPVRRYDVAAVDVDITLNRYLDHDPKGRMYVLESNLPRVRVEEARNAAARAGHGDPAVSAGLQGDAIQPLTLRAHAGECLRIHLRNALTDGAAASLHLHGAPLTVARSGKPAIATNRQATVAPGRSVTYEWAIERDEPEATHYFHSHGDTREQTSHGLFGALIVEPPGSTWLDPLTGTPTETGWQAIVRDPNTTDFREFVLYYHEVGNEAYQVLDRSGAFVPLVDPLTHAYRPDGRALDYRSEPFHNRQLLGQSVTGTSDESVDYSSYAYGDPATPLMRSYLGDPIKQRVVHSGSEVFHVHHVHGGSIRWRRQPGVEPLGASAGLDKRTALHPTASELTDSQSLGPSETFDVTPQCASGGCQQSTGDYLYHCHVAHHYFAGMWGVWRVYNTLQDGRASTDTLPRLLELPARAKTTQPGVTSDRLAGTTVDWSGLRHTIAPAELGAWVGRQLPPPGQPHGYDASVLDWRLQADVALGEPETGRVWPGYRSPAPGTRPPLLFDSATGKLAYPFLRPHLGGRPPFAPNHGPAPFLDPIHDSTDPPTPGENGPGSVCPAGTRPRPFPINAISVPVTYNAKDDIVDPAGEVFVLRSQEEAARADSSLRVPLALRANAGEDCVDVLLRSELADTADTPFSKVSLHIHFMQFDVQASDGVDNGFNYEQSVRPYAAAGDQLSTGAAAGALTVSVGSTSRYQPGIEVGVGLDQDSSSEIRRVVALTPTTLTFDTPLRFAHNPGEWVSTEFVRYRYFPDAQFSTAYFHDHVDAINSWSHGLFGAIVAEPPGSTYTDPHTGAPLPSGSVADIHTTGTVGADVKGSFRELLLFAQDQSPVNHVGRSSGGAYNLRAEPLAERGGDPALAFSSHVHGDPATPLLDANLGDPIVVRALVGATNDAHTVHVDGHWFRAEPWSLTSPPTNTIHVGISERFDLVIPAAGGPQRMPGDYLYYSGRLSKLAEGSWGIVRVHAAGEDGSPPLRKLPGHEAIPAAATEVCPPSAPVRRFDVHAVEVPLPMLGGTKGKTYVLAADEATVRSGREHPAPLVLHVNVGDCIKVALMNNTTEGAITYHCDLLSYDPADSGGVAAGDEPDRSVAPGRTRTYTYYASSEVGETTSLVRDWGDVLVNPTLGLYGAIVVGPPGSRYRDPTNGRDLSAGSSWQADVVPPKEPPYRDFTLFFQDQDDAIGTHRMPYTTRVDPPVGLNYEAAPLAETSLGAAARAGPPTPQLRAFVGDAIKIHAIGAASEQAQVFSVEGHRWPQELGRAGTNLLSSVQLGGLEVANVSLDGGAGGPARLAGDYIYGDHREPYREAGLWGMFRVLAGGGALRRLPGTGSGSSGPQTATTVGGLVLLSAAALGLARRRPAAA